MTHEEARLAVVFVYQQVIKERGEKAAQRLHEEVCGAYGVESLRGVPSKRRKAFIADLLFAAAGGNVRV